MSGEIISNPIGAPLLPERRGDEPGETPGAPARDPRPVSPLTSVCPYILGNELCERLAYYGLATNLVVYFHEVRAALLCSLGSGCIC